MPNVNMNLYDNFRLKAHESAAVDVEGDTVKLAVVTGSYTPNQATHDFWDDVSANEVTGTNYAQRTLANGAATLATGTVTVDFDDPTAWSQHASGFSNGRRLVIYQDSGLAATSVLIAYSDDFGADKGNVDGDFTVTFDALGLFTNT